MQVRKRLHSLAFLSRPTNSAIRPPYAGAAAVSSSAAGHDVII